MTRRKKLTDIDADALQRALSPAAQKLVSTKATAERDKPMERAPRSAKSLLLPDYVWQQLRRHYGETGRPMNVQVMEALRAVGFEIKEEDLIDGRTLR
jgi:hypothetical protein